MMKANFIIVTFVDEDDSPGIIASNWMNSENTCLYPNVRTEQQKEKLLKKKAEPENTWPQYTIKILKRYDTYGEARLNLRKAEETSNLESDDEEINCKRRIRKVTIPEESDSSDDYPIRELNYKTPQKSTNSSKYPTPPKPVQQTVPVEIVEEVEINNMTEPTPSSKETCNRAMNCPSGCIVSKQFAIQQSHLIQVVTDLAQQMTELNRKVDLLLVHSAQQPLNPQTEDPFAVPDFLASLPVKDDTSFCQLNDQLQINQNKQAIIKYLAGIGGRDIRTLTTNMLRRVLLDDVAELYSLTGKQMKNSNKKPFLPTETCKIIFQIAKKIHEDVTEEKLKEITSDWLNQAKIRVTRRLLVYLAVVRSAASITSPSLDDLLADIFGTNLDSALDDKPPPKACASLEGQESDCYECYFCNDTRIMESRVNGPPVVELVLNNSTCSSVKICCLSQSGILAIRGRGNCGRSNPDGKPRKRRPAVRAVLQGEFPWRAWVYKKNSQTPLCAATFIDDSSKALLTLASCVQGLSAGGIEVSFTKEGSRSAVEKVMVHGSYSPGSDVNNIAILQLSSLESTPGWAAPACLPESAPMHTVPCVTTSAKDIRLNTIIPLRKACYANKTEPPPELTCATAPFNDYHPETAAGLYCKEQHATPPLYILNGIAIRRLDDAVASYVNVWTFIGWIKQHLGPVDV